MENYSIVLSGQNLDTTQLLHLFGGYETLERAPKTPDDDKWLQIFSGNNDQNGIERTSNNDGPLYPFLEDIELRLKGYSALGIEEAVVWAFYYRDEQINAWLTTKEIASLHRLNATFCWSVI